MKNKSLKGQTIVITGASSGIGKATALMFAKEGANLVLASRSDQILSELCIECESLGAEAYAIPTDVSNRGSVEDLFKNALEHFGDISIWINNAGVGAIGEFTEVPLEAHEQVIRTNLLGPMYGSHVALTYFKKKGRGTIINTNSTGAFVGNPFTVSYSASKFGLRGLCEALRFELKPFPKIKVCELYAGFVDSPAHSHAANYVGKEIKPAKPLVQPEEMAKAILSLAKNPKPSIHLGVQDRLGRFGHMISTELTGAIMDFVMRSYFKKARKVDKSDGNLFAPDYDRTFIHGGFS